MKRGQKLQNISVEIGLSYEKRIDKLPGDIVDNNFLLFSSLRAPTEQGLAGCFENILSGESEGLQLFLADFLEPHQIYTNPFNHKQTIAVVRSTDFSFQKFCLTPKKTERFTVRFEWLWYDFILPRFKGYKNLPIPSDCPLRSKYVLKAKNAPDLQEILNTPFMQYLADHTGWSVEGSGDSLLIYQRWKKVEAENLREFIRDVVKIGRLLAPNKGPKNKT